MSSLKYEIRNKHIEAAHPIMPGECITRKMTDEEGKGTGRGAARSGEASISEEIGGEEPINEQGYLNGAACS